MIWVALLVLVIASSLPRLYTLLVLHFYRHYRTYAYFKAMQSHHITLRPLWVTQLFIVLCVGHAFLSPALSHSHHAYLIGFMALLSLIICIDYKLYLIPHALLIPLAILGLLWRLSIGFEAPSILALHVLIFYLTGRLLIYFMYRLMGQEGVGHGDLHFLIALLFWFDLYSVMLILLLACGAGLVYIFIHNMVVPGKPLHVIAFGPWIGIASFLVLTI